MSESSTAHSATQAVMGYAYPIKNAIPMQENGETETDKNTSGVRPVYKKPVVWMAALVGGVALLLLPRRKRRVQ